jgi:hypothetical protein
LLFGAGDSGFEVGGERQWTEKPTHPQPSSAAGALFLFNGRNDRLAKRESVVLFVLLRFVCCMVE